MFKPCKILVIGDVILDIYVRGSATRLSQEAPVPVVLVDKQAMSLGGASNVCANLQSLGAEVYLCGVVGRDTNSDAVINMLNDIGVHTDAIMRDINDSPTIVKTRVISNGQHIVRYDVEQRFEVNSQQLIDALSSINVQFDAVIISDYDKGTISQLIVEFVKSSYKCPVFVDPKPSHKTMYTGLHCMTPNIHELKNMSSDPDVKTASLHLKKELNLDCIVVTLSEKGVMLLDEDDNFHELNAHKLSVIQTQHSKSDVTGAGDTLISAFVIAICSGFDYITSLKIANIAAAIVVNKLGTVTCQIEELKKEIKNLESGSLILQN